MTKRRYIVNDALTALGLVGVADWKLGERSPGGGGDSSREPNGRERRRLLLVVELITEIQAFFRDALTSRLDSA